MKTAENLLRLLGVKSYTQRHIQIINDFLKSGEEEYRSNFWTSPCICPPDEKTGETLCCNNCGRPTARTSEELPRDEEMKDWAEIHAIHCYHDGLTSKKHFVEGYLYAVDFFKNNYASPLLASKDARIRELEEENKKLSRSIKFCKASINGALDGLQLDNTSDVIEKSTVIEQLNEELKILTPPKN